MASYNPVIDSDVVDAEPTITTERTPGWAEQFAKAVLYGASAAVLAFIAIVLVLTVIVAQFVDSWSAAISIAIVFGLFGMMVVASLAGFLYSQHRADKRIQASQERHDRQIALTQQAAANLVAAYYGQTPRLPPAPAQSVPQIPEMAPARNELTINGRVNGIEWDRDSVLKAASMIYFALYEDDIEPTGDNIKAAIPDLSANTLITAAMQHLKGLGYVTGGGKGSKYQWRRGLTPTFAPAHKDA